MTTEAVPREATNISENSRISEFPVVITFIPLSSFGTGSRLDQSFGDSIKIDFASFFQRLIGIRNDGVRLVLVGAGDDFK